MATLRRIRRGRAPPNGGTGPRWSSVAQWTAWQCGGCRLGHEPSHLFPMGDLPHLAAYQLAGRVWHTHLSDNDGTTNAHWRPGKGKIDWGALLQALQR